LIGVATKLLADASTLTLEAPRGVPLRGGDAIHVTGALQWFERARALNIEPGVFVVADRRLSTVATALGLHVENPEDYE